MIQVCKLNATVVSLRSMRYISHVRSQTLTENDIYESDSRRSLAMDTLFPIPDRLEERPASNSAGS